MRIVYLYNEVMGYTLATLRALAELGFELDVVHWDAQKLTPFRIEEIPRVTFHPKSHFDRAALLAFVGTRPPALTVINGWVEPDYMHAVKHLRASGHKVVCTLDGQWHHTPRQRLAALLGNVGYFRRYFSHTWVAGPRQAEYASRLGFARASLVYDFYSADIGQFAAAEVARVRAGLATRQRRFLFVGRFEPVKGLDTLIDAWRRLEGERAGWELHLVGSGSLATTLGSMQGVTVKPFAQSSALVREFADADCFVLPSKFEPWGVVVHEAAAAGLPIIASSAVGAADTFLISGHNGYTFRAGENAHLAEMMRRVIAATDGTLDAMGRASSRLSTRITPETSAANLVGLLS